MSRVDGQDPTIVEPPEPTPAVEPVTIPEAEDQLVIRVDEARRRSLRRWAIGGAVVLAIAVLAMSLTATPLFHAKTIRGRGGPPAERAAGPTGRRRGCPDQRLLAGRRGGGSQARARPVDRRRGGDDIAPLHGADQRGRAGSRRRHAHGGRRGRWWPTTGRSCGPSRGGPCPRSACPKPATGQPARRCPSSRWRRPRAPLRSSGPPCVPRSGRSSCSRRDPHPRASRRCDGRLRGCERPAREGGGPPGDPGLRGRRRERPHLDRPAHARCTHRSVRRVCP